MVDGLGMLLHQARPGFRAWFGPDPAVDDDLRSVVLAALAEAHAMYLLGLTGSIAMGKSTAAKTFRSFGLPVFDADAAVHRLLGPGGAGVGPVSAVFPVAPAAPDRPARLGRGCSPTRRRWPAWRRSCIRWCGPSRPAFSPAAAARGERLAVLDIPLLFETGGERLVDAVAVVSAPAFLQSQRVLRRPGMTPARLAAIRARQLPDGEKRRRADFVIPTGSSGAGPSRRSRRSSIGCAGSGLRGDRLRGRRAAGPGLACARS